METNRRSFFKTLVGFFTLPAGLNLAKQSKQKITHEKFNCNNLKCDGTFKQWVESIAQEVKRLLTIKSNEPDAHYFEHKYAVDIEQCDWSSKQDSSMPALNIVIYLGDSLYLKNNFSFAKFEWDRNYKCPKALQQIAHVRFIDCIWSMYNLHREHCILLKKLGADPFIYQEKIYE